MPILPFYPINRITLNKKYLMWSNRYGMRAIFLENDSDLEKVKIGFPILIDVDEFGRTKRIVEFGKTANSRIFFVKDNNFCARVKNVRVGKSGINEHDHQPFCIGFSDDIGKILMLNCSFNYNNLCTMKVEFLNHFLWNKQEVYWRMTEFIEKETTFIKISKGYIDECHQFGGYIRTWSKKWKFHRSVIDDDALTSVYEGQMLRYLFRNGVVYKIFKNDIPTRNYKSNESIPPFPVQPFDPDKSSIFLRDEIKRGPINDGREIIDRKRKMEPILKKYTLINNKSELPDIEEGEIVSDFPSTSLKSYIDEHKEEIKKKRAINYF
jgi:hypothetical protein